MGNKQIPLLLLSFMANSFALDSFTLKQGLNLLENINEEQQTSSCVEPDLDSMICKKEKESYLKLRDHYQLLFKNPESLGYPEKVRYDGMQTKAYDRDMFKTRKRLHKIVQTCQEKRMRQCHSDTKKEIGIQELQNSFNSLKQDTVFRMGSPAVHCYHRAYLLSKKLTEKGYKVNLLHIGNAPSLVAMNLDKNDQLIDRDPIDYHGIHWVVSISAKDSNGKSQSYVLDPQFTKGPMLYKDYFKLTLGQNCKKSDYYMERASFATTIKKWECGYKKYPANHLVDFHISRGNRADRRRALKGEDILNNERDCGFSAADTLKEDILAVNGNFTPTNLKLLSNKDGRKLRSETLIKAYESHHKGMLTRKAELEKYIQELSTKKEKESPFYDSKENRKWKKKYKKELRLINRMLRRYQSILQEITNT